MEWLFPFLMVGVIVGLFAYLSRQKITGSLYGFEESKPILHKAKTEQEIKDDWIAQFKGEMSEGNHKIVKTWYAKMVRKDGTEWPKNGVGQYWPTWECSCGESGNAVVRRSGDLEDAEKRALEGATGHVNDMNYIEWKNNNKLDGRAF